MHTLDSLVVLCLIAYSSTTQVLLAISSTPVLLDFVCILCILHVCTSKYAYYAYVLCIAYNIRARTTRNVHPYMHECTY